MSRTMASSGKLDSAAVPARTVARVDVLRRPGQHRHRKRHISSCHDVAKVCLSNWLEEAESLSKCVQHVYHKADARLCPVRHRE